jgi:hypothetical protein
MYITVFWDVVPCSLVEMTNVSEVISSTIIVALMTEAVSTSVTVNFYQSVQHKGTRHQFSYLP